VTASFLEKMNIGIAMYLSESTEKITRVSFKIKQIDVA